MDSGKEAFLTPGERETLIRVWLGKTAEVCIDRPIGYLHQGDIRYSLNYGFLPGITGRDGEDQDVYLYGGTEPLERFRGRIVAVIRRKDDCEDKFVAVPEGMPVSRDAIARAVNFVEQYFDSDIQLWEGCL